MSPFLIPAGKIQAEIIVSNSRFISSIGPVFSIEEARTFIKDISNEFKDATHNVPAFIIGHGASTIEHCHDDGEPSGTAGRPILSVLKGSKLGDIAAVVTRYFGGTKLGKGGLVKAYGDAVHAAIDILPIAEKTPTHVILVVVNYPLFEKTQLLIEACQGKILDRIFEVDVTITAQLRIKNFQSFQEALIELSNGKVKAEIIETNNNTIIPIN